VSAWNQCPVNQCPVPACWPYAILSLPAIFAGTAAVATALAVLSFLPGPARSSSHPGAR